MEDSHKKRRFKSVRSTPTSFSGWRETVRNNWSRTFPKEASSQILTEGSYLWKVRRKNWRGLVWYRRHFKLDLNDLCIHYNKGSQTKLQLLDAAKGVRNVRHNEHQKKVLHFDVADIAEIRQGFVTDTFNQMEKRMRKQPKSSGSDSIKVDHCFSIIFDPKLKMNNLDLVAEDEVTCRLWTSTLRSLLTSMKNVHDQREYENFLRKQFQAADASGSGYLFIDEFAELLKQMNIELSKNEIEEIFNEINTDQSVEVNGKQVIDEKEFLQFYHDILEREEIYVIFDSFARALQGRAMTLRELKKFLLVEQKIADISDDECRSIINEYETSEHNKRDNLLSAQGFSHFLIFSSYNDITETSPQVDQDMSFPLSDYFIATSHNTYLMGNQMTSESSIDAYIRVLKQGCRCVELDCWDGPDNEPIVYHGWTLTSKLDFIEVLEDAIKPYAFYASDFPLILSIENHCSKKQQDRMAFHLKEVLGEMLFLEPVDESRSLLPSPYELRRKVLVKAKKVMPTNSSGDPSSSQAFNRDGLKKQLTVSQQQAKKKLNSSRAAAAEAANNLQPVIEHQATVKSVDHPVQPDQCANNCDEGIKKRSKRDRTRSLVQSLSAEGQPKTTKSARQSLEITEEMQPEQLPSLADKAPFKYRKSSKKGNNRRKLSGDYAEAQHHSNSSLVNSTSSSTSLCSMERNNSDSMSESFTELINYCESVKFRSFDHPIKFWQMCSFEESKALQLSNSNRSSSIKFVRHNSVNLSRIYPRGSRVMSSNYDPLPFWLAGCQLVALNYQAEDRPLLFNTALFRQNGGCGYVLKPEVMRHTATQMPGPEYCCISNVHMPKPRLKLRIRILSGHHLPKSSESHRIKGDIIQPYVKIRILGHPADVNEHITKVVPKNGFNPVWEESVEFKLVYPEMAFLELRVKNGDYSKTDAHIGSFVTALVAIKQGYRNVHLENYAGHKLTPASLFVKISLLNIIEKKASAKIHDINDK